MSVFKIVCLSMLPVLAVCESSPAAPVVSLTLRADLPGATINRNIYGQFAEHLGRGIYEGIWVGPKSPIPNTRGIRNDVLAALRKLNVPVLRWPGGCFADEYHWKDGIGPRERRPRRINTHWGSVIENNHFGTHEFLDLCELLGAEPYISANMGSGTVQEMQEWIEYLTSDADSAMANLRRQNGRTQPWRIKYFGLGNESWDCGGNMRPEYYADELRRYSTFVRNHSGNAVYRIACGAFKDDYRWTETLMQEAPAQMDGLSLHYYIFPSGKFASKGSATVFGEDHWFSTLAGAWRMEELVGRHSAIMDRYDPQKRIGLIVDEWGAWYDVEPGASADSLHQQSSLRDALVAALHLHIFQNHADRVVMANIAQMVNVIQALILTDGPRMIVTPTYHVFDMFKVHQGATSLGLELSTPDYVFGDRKIPAVSAAASRDALGNINLSLINLDPHRSVSVMAAIKGCDVQHITGRMLTAPTMQTHNTFGQPDAVRPVAFDAFQLEGDHLSIELPAMSVVVMNSRTTEARATSRAPNYQTSTQCD